LINLHIPDIANIKDKDKDKWHF